MAIEIKKSAADRYFMPNPPGLDKSPGAQITPEAVGDLAQPLCGLLLGPVAIAAAKAVGRQGREGRQSVSNRSLSLSVNIISSEKLRIGDHEGKRYPL